MVASCSKSCPWLLDADSIKERHEPQPAPKVSRSKNAFHDQTKLSNICLDQKNRSSPRWKCNHCCYCPVVPNESKPVSKLVLPSC